MTLELDGRTDLRSQGQQVQVLRRAAPAHRGNWTAAPDIRRDLAHREGEAVLKIGLGVGHRPPRA
ncbi:hypothetical protein ABZ446_26770 [Streptomyces sp. NPDC005813]|uniref:hypothetical protein n=1 Tax=Streptomyces sp. NPDC005813 TaxID=3155592 RepID=UPI0033CAF2FE